MPDRSRRKAIKKAVSDPYLKLALDRSAAAYSSAHAEAMSCIDFKALQQRIRAIKERSISILPELVERFRYEAERVGAVVYEAKDAAAANSYISELARKNEAKLAVKSKSMLTEEIGLNAHLERDGISVVETDLGEWIIQLAGERPSHFTQPAVHKTREEIAELFSNVVGYKVEPDIPTLVEIARKQLRQAFFDADIGISGANILIAETGTIVIATNEGNSRLVTTLPPVHVAVVGYEKLVETSDEANEILKLLSKSGTGQKATAYVSYITGPSRTTDIEKTLTLGVHGPKEVHIVLVDNGRMGMLDDPKIKEALYCIKCGACLNVCPTYRAVGGHIYRNAYIGGIGAVVTAFHRGLDSARETLELCNGCRKCVEVCPSKIDTSGMTLELRRRLVKEKGLPAAGKLMLRGILKNPEVFLRAIYTARLFQTPLIRKDHLCRLPFMPDHITFPSLASKPLRDTLPDKILPKDKPSVRAAFFAGCIVDNIYPEIGKAAVEVLSRAGAEISFSNRRACCGAPALYCGDFDTAAELAKYNIRILEALSADFIITPCPTCAVVIKKYFLDLLKNTEWEIKASAVAEKVMDFSEFIKEIMNLEPPAITGRITYHDPCHQVRGIGGGESPRELIRRTGCDFVEMPESDVCCGFAGSYSMKLPEISGSILSRKLENIMSVDPEIVVTDCPGCIMQIRGGLRKHGSSIKVCHTAQLLANNVFLLDR